MDGTLKPHLWPRPSISLLNEYDYRKTFYSQCESTQTKLSIISTMITVIGMRSAATNVSHWIESRMRLPPHLDHRRIECVPAKATVLRNPCNWMDSQEVSANIEKQKQWNNSKLRLRATYGHWHSIPGVQVTEGQLFLHPWTIERSPIRMWEIRPYSKQPGDCGNTAELEPDYRNCRNTLKWLSHGHGRCGRG